MLRGTAKKKKKKGKKKKKVGGSVPDYIMHQQQEYGQSYPSMYAGYRVRDQPRIAINRNRASVFETEQKVDHEGTVTVFG